MATKRSRPSAWFIIGMTICTIIFGGLALVLASATYLALAPVMVGFVSLIIGPLILINYLIWGRWLSRRVAATGDNEGDRNKSVSTWDAGNTP